MQLVEASGLLIRVGEGREFLVLVMAGKERERNRRSRTANIVVIAIVNLRRLGSVATSQSIGHD